MGKIKFAGIFVVLFSQMALVSYASARSEVIPQIDLNVLQHNFNQNLQRPPNPLAYIHTEGTLPNAPNYDKYVASRVDLNVMHTAALAWKKGIQPDTALNMSKTYILAWIKTYKPSFNPIDESNFALLIDSYGMTRTQFSQAEQQQIDHYLKNWAIGYIQRIQQAPAKGTWINNWNSYRVELITMIAFVLKDEGLMGQAKDLFQQQIQRNIDAQGMTEDYKSRDAIHYVTYDLQPLIVSAYIAKLHGQNWYDWQATNQASLKKAVEWADPYTSGQIPHQEFAKTHVKFDQQRAAYGLQDYSGIYDPKKSNSYYWQLSLLNPHVLTQAQQLSHSTPLNLVFAYW